jgi:hypothetical protein
MWRQIDDKVCVSGRFTCHLQLHEFPDGDRIMFKTSTTCKKRFPGLEAL